MANEFVARQGIIALSGGAQVTGSLLVSGSVNASGYDIIARSFTGSFSGSIGTAGSATTATTASYVMPSGLPNGTVSSSTQIDYNSIQNQPTTIATASYIDYTNVANKPSLISSSAQFTSFSAPFTGSFTGSFKGDGSELTGVASSLSIAGSTSGTDTVNLKTETLVISGSSNVTATVTDNTITIGVTGLVSASGQIDHDLTANFLANEHIDHSSVSISAGSGLSGGGDITTSRTLTLDTSSAHFTDGIKSKLNTEGVISSSAQVSYTGLSNVPSGIISSSAQVTTSLPNGVVSSSGQVDVRNTTGIATIATTGSNTFTGVQTISNTTNSTNYTDGALIVQGGVGIAKDVNISGSVNIQGLLTVASMSTQYVTSSQYNIGVSRIVVNDDDLVRFAGISVIDSGSTYGTGSLLWDSLNNRWIYEADDQTYNSAVIIAGPKNTGTLGSEVGLTDHRIPVAHGDDHIDSRPESSSIRVDFPSRLTHVEAGLVVTGSITSSVGFSGDGSQLTGIVSTLNVTGSQSGTGTVNLKTQGLIVSGTNGITATVSGQTVTLSGSNATTTAKGVASFNATNFTVTGGEVTSNNITINGTTVTLGGTRNITLGQITTQGASTTDAVTLSGGATIGASFNTSSTYIAAGPTTNEVVLSLATGSFDAAHFNYIIKNGANLRTGTVMTVWNAGSIEYTDTSTTDIGTTAGADFVVDSSAGNVRLKFTVSSGTWTIKTAAQLI